MGTPVLLRNNVKVFGRGAQPMVFAHGFGCDQNMWRYVYPAFEASHRIVLFDYVGAGKSDLAAYNPERYRSLHGYADDILEVIYALELENVVFVGHSVSAMTGMLAAIREPHLFSRLILVGPSPCYLNEADYVGGFERKDLEELMTTMESNYVGWANFLAPVIMKNPERPELTEELKESFCSTDPAIARRFAEATFFSDNRADLPKLKVPALILQCTDDLIAPLEVGRYVNNHIRNSTLQVLHATGHCPHISEPEEVISAIRAYLHPPFFN